jgi:DNA mismatch endonuclease (patch repair protein)
LKKTTKEKPKNDLAAIKRNILKEKRKLRAKILGVDEVDGNTMQRVYGELTKTRRALKVELFGSKTKASGTDGEDTSIEKFVEECLIEAGLNFKKQKAIRFINVDMFLPDHNIVIQVHGCYWHACSKCYPAGPKNNIQRKNIEKDKVANEIIEKAGYKLFEIWAHEIEENPEDVKRRISEIAK